VSQIGELIYDIEANVTMVYTGHGWAPIPHDNQIAYCQYCKAAEWSHNEGFTAHPFISNNLEFLEWKSATRE
jgi:hypothetical protein